MCATLECEVVPPPSVEDIRKAAREAERSLHRTMGMVGVTIRRMVRVGNLLRRKRGEFERGKWMDWVEFHFPEYGYLTFWRWIKLAEFDEKRPTDLENAQTVRHAYVLAGLLPASEQTQNQGAAAGGNYLVHVTKLESAIEREIQAKPLEQWSAQDRQILRQRLQKLVDLYEQLCA